MMDSHDAYDLVDRVIWQVESDLPRAPRLRDLAAAAGVSRFHLTRAFGLRTGLSLMAYVRARRLTRAAQALTEPGASVTEAAFDAGYDSVEGFARAFRARFGLAPSAFRDRPDPAALQLQEPLTMTAKPARNLPEPRLETIGKLRLVGRARRFTLDGRIGIPGFWTETAGAYGDVMDGGETFGVCHDFDGDENFGYFIGWPDDGAAHPDLDRLEVPAGTFAVFPHRGHISTIGETWDGIFANWMPKAGMQIADGPQFERYVPGFDPAKPDGVAVWIPVAPAR